tara:strand:+ start:84 stop:584 length:501 start_codon:yes stop_codon:yes gene_type:complete
MLEGLHLVEVLTILLLETVLAVENKLEGLDGTVSLLSPDIGTIRSVGTELEERGTTGRGGDESGSTGLKTGGAVGGHDSVDRGGEVPKVGTRHDSMVGAENQLLDWVIVREADLLGGTGIGHSVGASVLNLLNEVLVALLRESPTLLSVEVNVISPDLEGAIIGIQ